MLKLLGGSRGRARISVVVQGRTRIVVLGPAASSAREVQVQILCNNLNGPNLPVWPTPYKLVSADSSAGFNVSTSRPLGGSRKTRR